MTQETKPGQTVYEDEESQKKTELVTQMMKEFVSKYRPSIEPEGCDLKSSWEIAEMFESIVYVPTDMIARLLMDLGYKTTLIGNEFRWMLRPTY